MGIDLPSPAKHIRLTSHHPIEGVAGAPLIRWGAEDPLLRAPVRLAALPPATGARSASRV